MSRLTCALIFGLCAALWLTTPAFAQDTEPECNGNDGCEICREEIPEPLVEIDEEDPLGDVAKRMGGVAKDLSKGKTDKKVQRKQREIVSQLDTLIERLRRKAGG